MINKIIYIDLHQVQVRENLKKLNHITELIVLMDMSFDP